MNDYRSLAVKYRPQTFADVTEQTVTVKILEKVIENKSFKNVYLFSGKTGAGKTTCARIFAKAINQGIGDPIELDCASNNGVDDVRNIIEAANQRALTGEYKIFILDECHAITTAGWQAFLKGIEETPKYTIFIFCTTEPNKIPATVLNRMQRYNFSNISVVGIRDRLKYICQQEGFVNYEDTCDLIAKISQGSMRDAITSLEQCADLSKDLSLENTKELLGDFSYEMMMRLTNFLIDKNEIEMIKFIENMYNSGRDLKTFVSTYLSFILDLIKYILFKDINLTTIPAYLENTQEQEINIKYTTGSGEEKESLAFFNRLADLLLEIKTAIRNDPAYKSTIIVMLSRVTRC